MKDEVKATIQIDKLTLCCISTQKDNFNELQLSDPNTHLGCFPLGNVSLSQCSDDSGRYKYCFNVRYENILMGKVKFGLYGRSQFDNKVWFAVHNQVAYKNYLQLLPIVLDSLHLKIHNITRMEIALDNYSLNFEQHLRRCLKNKEYKVKLFGRYIKDRKQLENRITYWNFGSLDNPFKIRSLYLKNKRKVNYGNSGGSNPEDGGKSKDRKTTIEMVAYDKLAEIENHSPHKTYILDYHKEHNSNYKHIYRKEIRLESEELRRLESKWKKQIEVTDLLDKQFLFKIFVEYMDRIIVIRDTNGKKIDLFPTPFLDSYEGKLPLTLPAGRVFSQPIKITESSIVKNEILDSEEPEDFEELIYNNPIYFEYYENTNTIRSNQEKNKPIYEGGQQSQFWKTPFIRT